MQTVSRDDLLQRLDAIAGLCKTPTLNAALLNPTASCFISHANDDIDDDDDDVPLFVCLVQFNHQVRTYCSYEASQRAHRFDRAAKLYKRSLEWHMSVDKDPTRKYGAVNSIFVPVLASLGFSVNLGKLWDVFIDSSSPSAAANERPSLSAIESRLDAVSSASAGWNLCFDRVAEHDIDQVLSTSEIAHPPAYLRAILDRSSAIYDSHPGRTDRLTLVAHVFTMPDGSIGTLHVSPAYRRHGLGKLVAQHRIASASAANNNNNNNNNENDRGSRMLRSFACVGETNAQSRALMQSLGWQPTWKVAWIYRATTERAPVSHSTQ